MHEAGDDQRRKSSDHPEVPLCSLSLSNEGSRTVTQRATFVLLTALTLMTALPLTGCGGEDTTPTEEKEANVEEEAAPDEAPVEALPAYEPGQDTDTEICQIGEALEALGPEGLQGLTDELSEEVSAGRFANMQEALASRGYTCNAQVG